MCVCVLVYTCVCASECVGVCMIVRVSFLERFSNVT